MERITQMQKAQGATEYLVTMGVILMIALVCIGLLVWPTGTTKDAKKSQTDIHFKIAAMEYPDLLQGLVAYWKFDEGSGTTAADSRGGTTGNLTNSPTWVTGKSGNALDFNGINNYVQIDSGQFASCSMSAWIKPGGATVALQNIIGGTNSLGQADFLSYISLNDDWLTIYNGSSYIYGNHFGFGGWNHVAFTFDGTTGNFIMYQNGSQTQTGHSNYYNCRATSIGMFSIVSGRYFNGTIDEVMIFNRALSAGEIRLLYENPGYPQ